MKTTGFVFDEKYLLHKTFDGHPECAERLLAIISGLNDTGLLPKLLPIKPEPPNQRWIEAVHNIRYIMKFEEACKFYGEVRAADHVSLDIRREEFVTLLGASGSGKTTMLMMVAGFTPPDKGRVVLDSQDITLNASNSKPVGGNLSFAWAVQEKLAPIPMTAAHRRSSASSPAARSTPTPSTPSP